MAPRPIIVAGVCAAIALMAGTAIADPLQQQLQDAAQSVYEDGITGEVRRERLADLERTCVAMAGRQENENEQGVIYGFLASTYAQTHPLVSEKARLYCEKAVALPLGPREKAQLYIYWGDVIQVAHAGVRGQALAAARKEAVVPYLRALKETLVLDQPEEPGMAQEGIEAPQRPPQRGDVGSVISGRMTAAEHEALRFQREMQLRRDTATNHVAFMYSRMPFATAELEKLAAEEIQDPVAVARLMGQVKERIDKRIRDMGGTALTRLSPELTDQPLPEMAVEAAQVTADAPARQGPQVEIAAAGISSGGSNRRENGASMALIAAIVLALPLGGGTWVIWRRLGHHQA